MLDWISWCRKTRTIRLYLRKSTSIQPTKSPPKSYCYIFSHPRIWCRYTTIMYSSHYLQAREGLGRKGSFCENVCKLINFLQNMENSNEIFGCVVAWYFFLLFSDNDSCIACSRPNCFAQRSWQIAETQTDRCCVLPIQELERKFDLMSVNAKMSAPTVDAYKKMP